MLADVTDKPEGFNGLIQRELLSCLGDVEMVGQMVLCSTRPLKDPGSQRLCPLQPIVSRLVLDIDIRLADGEGRKWKTARAGSPSVGYIQWQEGWKK